VQSACEMTRIPYRQVIRMRARCAGEQQECSSENGG
jgi:hypothetical protein